MLNMQKTDDPQASADSTGGFLQATENTGPRGTPGLACTPAAPLDALELTELRTLDLAALCALDARLTQAKAALAHCEAMLQSELDRRFALRAQALRIAAGKSTGTVRIAEDTHVVVASLPKKTSYDQAKLKEAVASLRACGENPEHYVEVIYQVPESRYQAWPPSIRALFDPARTVKAVKPSYAIAPANPSAPKAAAFDAIFGEKEQCMT